VSSSSSSSSSACTVNIYQVDLVHIDTPLLFVPLFSLVFTISSASSLACTVNIYQVVVFGVYRKYISGRFGTHRYTIIICSSVLFGPHDFVGGVYRKYISGRFGTYRSMTYEVPSVDPTDSYVEFYVRKQKSFCLSDCQIDSYVEPFVGLIPMLIFRYKKNSFGNDLFFPTLQKKTRERNTKNTQQPTRAA
jgi:hypothetical protein